MNEAAANEAVDPKATVLAWWQDLEKKRGERAELRRARSLDEVVFTPAYQRLWQRLRGSNWADAHRVALVAAVVSHLEQHDPARNFAEQLAAPGHGEKSRYSGLRFRRLLQRRELDELREPVIRALRMVERRVDVVDLAESLYWWNDRTRRRWAFAYYGRNPKAD